MNTTTVRLLLLAAAVSVVSTHANAWQEVTHRALTDAAVDGSILNSLGAYTDIGILDPSEDFPDTAGGYDDALKRLLRNGAAREDDFPRMFNHFFDPSTGGALTFPVPDAYPRTALEWALEHQGDISSAVLMGAQECSMKNARDYLHRTHLFHLLLSRHPRRVAAGLHVGIHARAAMRIQEST